MRKRTLTIEEKTAALLRKMEKEGYDAYFDFRRDWVELGPQAIAPLLHILQRSEHEFTKEEAIETALCCLGPEVVEPLLPLLAHEKPVVRMTAASTLGHFGDERVVAELLGRLGDDNEGVRREIVSALGKIARPGTAYHRRIEGELLSRFFHDTEVEAVIALTLGNMRSPRAVKPLLSILRRNQPDRWDWAAAALADIGNDEAVDGLIALLEDSIPRRLSPDRAARTLGTIPSARAISALIRRSQEWGPVAATAKYALSRNAEEHIAAIVADVSLSVRDRSDTLDRYQEAIRIRNLARVCQRLLSHESPQVRDGMREVENYRTLMRAPESDTGNVELLLRAVNPSESATPAAELLRPAEVSEAAPPAEKQRPPGLLARLFRRR